MNKIDRHATLLFDASVLVAGAHSRGGGSAPLLEACKLGGFTAQASHLVLLEALTTIKRGFPERSQVCLTDYLAAIDWELLPVPSREKMDEYAALIDLKDLHVLAAAVVGKSQFLLTLDRRHVLAAADAVQSANLPLVILRPGALPSNTTRCIQISHHSPSPRR